MGIKRRGFLASVGSVAGMAAVPAVASAAAAKGAKGANGGAPLYRNAGAPVAARVEDLLGRMTLEEKIAQLQCVWLSKKDLQNEDTSFNAQKAQAVHPHGMGMFARPSDRQIGADNNAGNSGAVGNRGPKETADYVNAVQKWALENTRLGIPAFMHEESLHGYVAPDATSFPQAIGLASSFDPEMVTQIFSFAAKEMRARGANVALAPVVDVAREPRWGRIEETYGEDPHLCYAMGKAAVRGFSGDTLPLGQDKVYATLKHMTGHGQPESGTNIGPANVGERTLREDFFPPFEKIIKETKIAAVMPSYNEIDGIPSHANRWLLTDVLRKEWGFQGITVSDYMAVAELISRHHLAATPQEAGLRAFKAGVDIETPDPMGFATLAQSVKEGKLKTAEIDTVVRRILRLKFEAGLFENPYADAAQADARTASPEAIALARVAGTRSAVLLKNDKGLLPLAPKKVGKLLLLGTHAKDTPIGGYSDKPKHVVSVYEALEQEAKSQGFTLAYSEGVRLTEGHVWGQDEIKWTKPEVNAKLIADAVAAAKTADTIVMVLGDNEQTAREAWADNHLGDRTSLDLVGQQNDLARAIFALNKPTVAAERPSAVRHAAGRARRRAAGMLVHGPGNRPRRCRPAVRPGQPGRQAARHDRTQRGTTADVLQPQAEHPSRLYRRRHDPAVPVRLRPVVHQVRDRHPAPCAGPHRRQRLDQRAGRRPQHRFGRRRRGRAAVHPRRRQHRHPSAARTEGVQARHAAAGRKPHRQLRHQAVGPVVLQCRHEARRRAGHVHDLRRPEQRRPEEDDPDGGLKP
jgi:beta-glucosidase